MADDLTTSIHNLECWFNLEWPTMPLAIFVRDQPYANIVKTISELHALPIEYEKGKGKGKGKGKDKSYIPKPKNPKPSIKEHPTKDDACHHYKEVGHCKRNCPAYLAELIKKKKQVGTASSSDIFVIELFSFLNKSWVYDTDCGFEVVRGRCERILFKPNKDLLILSLKDTQRKQQSSVGCENLKKSQKKDTLPFKNTSEIPVEVEGFEPPQEEEAPVRRSVRAHRAPERFCLYVEVEEHSLEDLNEPTNYKAALLDPESEIMKKTDMDDNVHTYKARLVAKGFTQTYGVDYEETFSPIADIRAIRILIAIAHAGFETDREDIKSQTVYVFILNGGTVDWKSSKQSTTTMSATEAEYIAALEAAMEVV
ncbi:retrotransposon protein, putative, ty1-copia subclass [Tanacetum coccineum]